MTTEFIPYFSFGFKKYSLRELCFYCFIGQKIKELKLQIDCETKRYTDLTYCLKNEQQCFKNTRRSRMLLDPIKHVLRVFFKSFKDPCLLRDFDSKRDMNALKVSYIQTGKCSLFGCSVLNFRKLFLEMPLKRVFQITCGC